MRNEVQKITTPYCQKILPLVYDDSLSYYEAICKFVKKVNELVDEINGISDEILQEAKDYTDKAIAEQQEEVDEQIERLQNLVNSTRVEFEALIKLTRDEFAQTTAQLVLQYNQFVAQVNAKIDEIDNRITSFETEIRNTVVGINARTDKKIEENNEYIFSQIEEHLGETIKVINFFTGEKTTIQEMFNYLAQFHVANSISYSGLIAKNKTYTEFVNYHMTYAQLIMNGGSIIV